MWRFAVGIVIMTRAVADGRIARDDAARTSGRAYRVLYEDDAGERGDNYTDPETFLARMRLNRSVKTRSYATSALAAWTISQQCAVVAIQSGSHAAVASGRVDVGTVTRAEIGALAAGLTAWAAGGVGRGDDEGGRRWTMARVIRRVMRSVRLGALTIGGLAALTPLCQTMTAAVSSDTAATCATLALALYAITYDYAFINLETKQLASSFSLGASMFASMLMASRLDDSRAVFADALLALECYVLSPFVWRAIREISVPLHLTVVFTLHVIAFIIVASHDAMLAWAYAAFVILLGVVVPARLVRLAARGKQQITGPWDEALPKLYLFKNTERASGVPRYRHWAANK